MHLKKYWPIYISVLIFILIVTSFLWKEPLSLTKSINSDKFGDFGTLLASLLTGITVLLLYKQINEMILDRKASSQPDLYPTATNFETNDISVDNPMSNDKYLPIPFFYRIENGVKSNKFSTKVSLFNIGHGAAKEIKISWEYNEQDIIQIIQGKYGSGKYDRLEDRIDFAPANKNVEINLPLHYMKACGSLCNDTIGALFLNQEQKQLKPPLKLHLKFKDIFDNSHDRKFDVKFECFENRVNVEFHLIR